MISHTLRAMTFRGCETTRSAANASGRRSAAAGRPPISPKRRAPKKAMAQMIAMTGASTHTISDGVAPRPAAQPSSPMKFSRREVECWQPQAVWLRRAALKRLLSVSRPE